MLLGSGGAAVSGQRQVHWLGFPQTHHGCWCLALELRGMSSVEENTGQATSEQPTDIDHDKIFTHQLKVLK